MKAHLFSSEEPLVAGRDQDTACGRVVPKAVFLFSFDMGISGAATLSDLMCCRKCVEALRREPSRRYLYMLGNGEEVLHDEG